MMKKLFIFVSIIIFSFSFPADAAGRAKAKKPIHSGNSEKWFQRNAHLIPNKADLEAILALDQSGNGIPNGLDRDMDGDGIPNDEDPDIDGDGVPNHLDPSPYDWRETGYNPFGILAFLNWDHSWNAYMYEDDKLEKAVKLLKKLGVTYVRVDFSWDDIEPIQGEFEFEKYDRMVKLLTENDIRILGIASYCTSWAGQCWNNPPDELSDFTNYFGRVVDRYKNWVKYWEIWNEPDSRTYWLNQDRMKTYTELLRKSYKTAKKIDPSCRILMGGLTENSHIPLKHIYENGGKDYFDIVNIHPFVNPLDNNRLRNLRNKIRIVKRIMADYSDGDKQIWLTELGSPGVKNPTNRNGWWHGISPTENEQADWLEEIYTKVIEYEQVEKIFWAFYQDTPDHFHNGVDYFGIVREDFSLKPAFHVYKRIIDAWQMPE